MKIQTMIEELKNSGVFQLDNPVYIGILPNDGEIIAGYPQAILTFDETDFNIYTFKGIRHFSFDGNVYQFKFSEIKEIELGKYNFRNPYLKISFADQKYLAFGYYLRAKNYLPQKTNIEKFIAQLSSIATEVEEY
ncbi:MAG: hypothetical protein GX149_01560 [Acholeplasmataceae bacterium]|jgi:hypothetical protein|nr:hypothetical protein [Acholeplasmataceae bacterium]